ncbi:MAG: GntR family transcriptional regulator [Oscillospiraceae bacterium]|nr:GntR family transcriptional regulator [Oscillospiraceae bacterium]
MHVIISNCSPLPIYEQIKEQVKAQILSGELPADEMLPSLRGLAKDLKISVLTTTRAYNELEQEGFITSRQGKGFFVMPSGSMLIHEQLVREVEQCLTDAIQAAQRARLSEEEIVSLLRLLLEVSNGE